MKKPRLGGEGRSSRADAEREAQEELNRLTRQPGPPPGGKGVRGTGYQSQRKGFTPAAPAAPSGRPSFTSLRSAAPSPPAGGDRRSPGFGGGRVVQPGEDVDDEYDDEGGDEEGGDEDGIYYGPRTAQEEEEAVTGLALRDWAAGRGKADRWEEVALPRLDNSSIEAQRDRALQEIVARQERMQREYREQRARLQPVEGDTVADPRAAHQMNVLRRGKPPGMMNMAAVQTGAFNRQHRERMEAETAEAAKPAKGKAKVKSASTKAKPAAAKASARATKSAARAPARATKAAATKAAATKAAASRAKPAIAKTAAKAKPATTTKARPASTKTPTRASASKAAATRAKPATTTKAASARSTTGSRAATSPPPAPRRAAAQRQPAPGPRVNPNSPIARAAAALARREAERAAEAVEPAPTKSPRRR